MKITLVTRPNSPFFYIRKFENGKYVYESTGISDEKQAKEKFEDYKAKNRLGIVDNSRPTHALLLSELMPQFFIKKNLVPKSVGNYNTVLKHWYNAVGDKPMNSYTVNDNDIFVKYLRDRGIKNGITNYTALMFSIFSFAQKRIDERTNRPIVNYNPIEIVGHIVIPKKPISKTDLDMIFNYCNNHGYKKQFDLFGVAYYNALRISEAINLTMEQIDFENRTMKFISKDKKRIDTIPILDDAWEFLRQMKLPESGKISAYKDYGSLRVFWVKMMKDLNLEHTPHGFRRARGSQLANEGKDLYFLQKYMRHQNVNTTENLYTEVQLEKMRVNLTLTDQKVYSSNLRAVI